MMSNSYNKTCKCCRENFTTNRSDQHFINRAHQIRYNNNKQSDFRRKTSKIMGPLKKNFNIYLKLIGTKTETKVSKEFLKGCGANLTLFTHLKEIDNEIQPCLFDIIIIENNELITLKKYKND